VKWEGEKQGKRNRGKKKKQKISLDLEWTREAPSCGVGASLWTGKRLKKKRLNGKQGGMKNKKGKGTWQKTSHVITWSAKGKTNSY